MIAGRPPWWRRLSRQPHELDEAQGGGSGRVRECIAKLPAAADVELAEDLAQVVLDRPRADEQLGADLRVGAPLAGQSRDLELLGRQGVPRVRRDPRHGVAGGDELAAGSLGERFGAHVAEALVGGAKACAGVCAPVLAPQPFPVYELAAGELDGGAAAREALDRLEVEGLVAGHQRAAARFDSERPFGAARARAFTQAVERGGGLV